MKKIKKENETLTELMMGIVTAGLIINFIQRLICMANPQLAGTKNAFTLGISIGVAVAVGLAEHMYYSIDHALDMISNDAEGYMRKAYLIRTVVILAVAGIVTYLKLGDVMAYFLGVLCLKFGAFLQPLMHKIRNQIRK